LSTIDRPDARRVLPPLVAGQHLDQPTFHERYAAMLPEMWAELVGGIVSIMSPHGIAHGEAASDVGYWLGHYLRFTEGLQGPANATTILGAFSETHPDGQLRIPEELGGRTRIVDNFIVGPPELIIEIGRSSREFDLGPKKGDYERAGVLEYVAVALDPDGVRWFVRRGDRFEDLQPGPDGVFRSEVFPGLWLDPAALFAGDLHGLTAALERGLATPEHAAFVERLARARGG
jgi:Uma2 family endonuclease